MKRKGFNPFILLEDVDPQQPTDGNDNPIVIGGGSGEGAINPFPMSFDDWRTSGFQEDYTFDGEIDFQDYGQWWADNFGTSQADAWNEYNGEGTWQDVWGAP